MSSASSSSNYIKRFWALAVPACLAGLLQPLASFSDIVVLGRQSSTSVVAAVGLSANYFDIAYLSFGFLRMGTTAWLSHWLAERDQQAYRQQLVFALTFALGASLCIGCAYFIGRAFIGVPPPLVDGFWSYTEVRIIGAPMAMLNLVIVGYFIATERGKTALLHAFVVHGSNISLNILAVELLQLGPEGVALATVLSQTCGVLMGVRLIGQELGFKDVREAFEAGWQSRIRQSLHLNGLLVLRTWLMQGVFLWAQYTALGEGEVECAALTIWLRWLAFGSYFLDGLAHGVEGVAAQARKALDVVAFKRWVLNVVVISAGLGGCLGVSVIIGGESLHAMITADKAVISASLTIVNYLPGILLIGGIAYVLDGLSVAFADGAILIKMVALGALCTVVAGNVVPLDGLLLAVIGLSAFMVGRVLAGFTWIRNLIWA